MAKEKIEDVEPVFEDEGETTVEFVDESEAAVDPDAELPEDVKKTSKKDLYARVKELEEKEAKTSDPTDRITSAFEAAVGKMKTPEAPAPVQQAGESEADFKARLKKDLFDEDKAEGILNELIDRRLGPRLAQTVELNFKQAERLMELDPETGPIFKKYKGEIASYIKANFPQFAKDPRALELAFNQIRVAHVEEIAQERANAILESERKKAPARREPIQMEAGGTSSGSIPAPRKTIITKTAEDYRKADELGVDVNVIAERRARGIR